MEIQGKKKANSTKADDDFDLSIINGASAVAYDTPEPIRSKRFRPGSAGSDDDDYSSNTTEDNPGPSTTPPYSPEPASSRPYSPDPLATPPDSPPPARPHSPDPLATPPDSPGATRPYSPDPFADILVTPPYSPEPTQPYSPDPLATPPYSPGPTRPYSPDPLADILVTPPYSPGPTRPYSPDPLATPPLSPGPTRPYSPDPLASPPDSPGPTRPYSPDPLATPPLSPGPTRPYSPDPLSTPPSSPGPAANIHIPTPPGTPILPPNPPTTNPPNSAGGSGHVVIEIEEQPGDETESHEDETESPLYSFFKIVNFACLAPYRFSTGNEIQTFLKLWPYVIIHIFLAMNHLLYFKHHVIFGAYITRKSNIALYIDFAHSLLQPCLAFSVWFTLLLRFGSFKSSIEECQSSLHFQQFNKRKIRVIVSGMIGLGGILAVLDVILPIPENNVDMISNMEWIPTYYYRNFVCSLTAENYVSFATELLANKEETHWGLAIGFGTFICVIKIINSCVEQIGRLLVLLSALTLKHCSDKFYNMIPSKLQNSIVPSGDVITAAYSNLKQISKYTNESIYSMYPLFLADNLLTMASFYNQFFNPDVSIWTKLLSCMKVINITLTFCFAERVTNRITQFRDWLRDESQPALPAGEARDLRDDIQTNPIGIGKDSLFINKDFIISFFGISTAYFLSVVETRSVAS